MQTLYAHSRAVQQGVAYYAHPWDDGVTLLHRPAAGCPVIVDALMQAEGYSQNEYPRACIIDGVGISDIIGIEAVHTADPDAVIVTHT